jgi:two-component system OmpR family sensor kinase
MAMSEARPTIHGPDQAVLRKASLKIALRISAACAVLVLCLLAGAALYLMGQLSHPALTGSEAPDYAYLDAKDLLKALIIAGVTGVVLAGCVGWLSARSAIRPLGDAMALERRFVQDASHELRTPLAILDTRIQLAQRDTLPDSAPGKALALIREDAATLTAIVNELLVAATGATSEPPMEPTDLAAVTASVAASLQQVAHELDVSIILADDGRPFSRIDPNSVRRAVLALADNALAHTPAGGQVTLSTAVDDDQAVITVADTGAGITGVDQTRIFERFVRTPRPDETRPQRSFGIGLALVRDIVTGAGGTVEIARTGPDGTTMKIALPLAST